MVANMRFVGASVDELRKHGEGPCNGDVVAAAEALLATLNPIGDDFELAWKFSESLQVLAEFMPSDLLSRLEAPGSRRPENHLEASLVALALEAGIRLEPLTKHEMKRIQHLTDHLTQTEKWGRQSPYPWDTVADADLDEFDFFALTVAT